MQETTRAQTSLEIAQKATSAFVLLGMIYIVLFPDGIRKALEK